MLVNVEKSLDDFLFSTVSCKSILRLWHVTQLHNIFVNNFIFQVWHKCNEIYCIPLSTVLEAYEHVKQRLVTNELKKEDVFWRRKSVMKEHPPQPWAWWRDIAINQHLTNSLHLWVQFYCTKHCSKPMPNTQVSPVQKIHMHQLFCHTRDINV